MTLEAMLESMALHARSQICNVEPSTVAAWRECIARSLVSAKPAMTEVWLVWSDDDSPVACASSREVAERMALAIGEERVKSWTRTKPVEENRTREGTSFWWEGSNLSSVVLVRRLEVTHG